MAATVAEAAMLAACSSTVTPTPSIAPTATPTPAATPTPRTYTYPEMVVGFIGSGTRDEWHVENATSFKETATEKRIALKTYDSGGQIASQIAAFHQFDADPTVNVIVLDAVQSSGYDDVLREARAAGKVVVVEDRHIDADPNLYYMYVGSDFRGRGQMAAAAMCDLLKRPSRKRVAEVYGDAGDNAEIDIATGFREKAADCDITVPAELTMTGSPTTPQSKAAVSALLKRTSDLQGIVAHSDDEAIGVIEAIKEAGLVPGRDVQLVSIGASCASWKYLISAELGAAIEVNPLLAPQAYDAALKALNGDLSLPKWIPSQEGAFYASQGRQALECSSCPGYSTATCIDHPHY